MTDSPTTSDLLAGLSHAYGLRVRMEWRPADLVVGVRFSAGSNLTAGLVRVFVVPGVALRVEWHREAYR
jgi:hypothetical protein